MMSSTSPQFTNPRVLVSGLDEIDFRGRLLIDLEWWSSEIPHPSIPAFRQVPHRRLGPFHFIIGVAILIIIGGLFLLILPGKCSWR